MADSSVPLGWTASPDLPALTDPKITSMSYRDFQPEIYLAGAGGASHHQEATDTTRFHPSMVMTLRLMIASISAANKLPLIHHELSLPPLTGLFDHA